MILISVVVPIYNVERYIERCARSLFEQTMNERIEFIFVDDCSPDRSIEILSKILEEYPSRKSHTKIIHHSENKGLPIARRSGIAVAKGEYIAHCDSDDWMEQDAYLTLAQMVISKKTDMIVFNGMVQMGNNYKPIKLIDGIATINAENAVGLLLSGKMTGVICNKLVRRNIYERIDFLYPEANMGEGIVFSVQCCHYSQETTFLNVPLYNYFFNTESICHKPTEAAATKRSLGYKKNIDIVIEFLKRQNLYERYKYQVASFKFRCRMVSFIGKPNYSLWHSIYPELDTCEYISRMSGRELVQYLLIRLHLSMLYLMMRKVYLFVRVPFYRIIGRNL